MLVTDLYRPREETVEIYVAAGETPPRVSVHEVKPCRGADVAVRVPAGDGRWEQLSFGTARAIEGAVNAAWRYQESEAHQVALFHDIAGAHIHLQCRPGDETRRR